VIALSDPRSDPEVDAAAPLARAHPVAKLAVVTIIGCCLLVTVDSVTAGVCLFWEVLALPRCGLRPRLLARRCSVVLVGAVPAGVAALIFGQGPPSSALAISLRIMAIGLPGVVLLSTTDPTDLADGLAQVLRIPARFTLSGLAALRLFGVLASEWQMLGLARRARGLGRWSDNWRDPAALRGMWSQAFALLVLAIRRATILATAMEARGFGTDLPRTWARPSQLRVADAVVIAGAVAVAGVATAAGLWLGTWNFILS
jgi:energy-coupling factor transport system permease protein